MIFRVSADSHPSCVVLNQINLFFPEEKPKKTLRFDFIMVPSKIGTDRQGPRFFVNETSQSPESSSARMFKTDV